MFTKDHKTNIFNSKFMQKQRFRKIDNVPTFITLNSY